MGLIKKVVLGIVLNGLALYALTYFIEEITYTGGIKFFIIGGLILGVLNLIVKPLFKIVTFPLIFLTGGLFLIVINAVILFFLSYFLHITYICYLMNFYIFLKLLQ